MSAFKPIPFDAYVAKHLKCNRDEDEKDFRKRLREAVDAKKAGRRCDCGNPIWAVGGAVAGYMCFTCITGEAKPSGDYEIDETLDPDLLHTGKRRGASASDRRTNLIDERERPTPAAVPAEAEVYAGLADKELLRLIFTEGDRLPMAFARVAADEEELGRQCALAGELLAAIGEDAEKYQHVRQRQEVQEVLRKIGRRATGVA